MSFRARFSRPASRQRGLVPTLIIGLTSVIALAYFGWAGFRAAETVPGRSYYDIKAELRAADSITGQHEVRIGAERAGKVLRTSVKDGKALLDLRLNAKYRPLRSDSQLRVRLRSAVGVRYLEIRPGAIGRPLSDGDTLVGKEIEPVALDEVLTTFNPVTRERTKNFLGEFGAGVTSRGEDINATLSDAPGFLDSTKGVAAKINERPNAMGRLITSSRGAAEAFRPVKEDAASGFEPEAAALRPFSERADEVGATLAEASPTLRRLPQALPVVRRLVQQVEGLADETAPTLRTAPRALRETTRMLNVAQTPLRNIDGTIKDLRTAVNPTLALLERALPTLPRVDDLVGSLIPTVSYLEPRACELGHAWTGWAEWLKYGTAYSNFVRFEAYLAQPDGVAGFTSTPRLPNESGGDAFDSLNHQNPYPGPCEGEVGEGGEPEPIPEISAKGLPFNGRNP